MVQVKLGNVDKQQVAYVELTGPYENWGRGLMELKAWLDIKKAKIARPPMGLYYDNPTETPAEKLRSEACLPIAGPLQGEGKFKVKELPASEVASTVHEGPPEAYTRTYGPFLEWILTNGYKVLGPAREIYREPSPELRPGMGILIQQPIKKKS